MYHDKDTFAPSLTYNVTVMSLVHVRTLLLSHSCVRISLVNMHAWKNLILFTRLCLDYEIFTAMTGYLGLIERPQCVGGNFMYSLGYFLDC